MTLADRVVVMEDGELMQVDPPQQLYDYPQNRFVAEFIGSPSMNVVAVEVEKRGGGYVAAHPSFEVPLPTEPSLEQAVGEAAQFGVRPQDVHLVDDPTEFSFDVEVGVTENLGDQLLILGTIDDHDVRVLSDDPRQQLEPGEVLHVECDPDRLHVFDADTGRAIYHSGTVDDRSTGIAESGRPVAGSDR